MVAGTVEHELIATKVGNVANGSINLLLNRSHQGCALLEELALRTEVFLLELGGFLLFLDDSILTGLLLLLREEDDLVLIVLIEGLLLDIWLFGARMMPGFGFPVRGCCSAFGSSARA